MFSKDYQQFASARLQGSFGEMCSWPLVLPYLANKKVLDVGCANGLYLKHFQTNSVGIEANLNLVNAGKRDGLNIVCADVIEGLQSFDNNSFDGVLFSHVMEHLDSPICALREINRVLDSAGTLVIGLPIERSMFRIVLRMDYFDGTHIYAFTVKNAIRLLHVTGFMPSQVFYHLPKVRGKLGLLVHRLWNAAPWPFRERLSMAYWIVARKEHNSHGNL